MERSARVLLCGLLCLGVPIDTAPAPYDAIDVRRRSALATASNRSSVSGVATPVTARILEYEISARAKAWASRGSVPSARATRVHSRAAPSCNPTRHASQ